MPIVNFPLHTASIGYARSRADGGRGPEGWDWFSGEFTAEKGRFPLKAIYLDVSLSAPPKNGTRTQHHFCCFEKWLTFETGAPIETHLDFFKDFLNSSIFKVNTLEVYQLWMDTETS